MGDESVTITISQYNPVTKAWATVGTTLVVAARANAVKSFYVSGKCNEFRFSSASSTLTVPMKAAFIDLGPAIVGGV